MRSCGIVLAWGYAWLGDAIWLVAGCLAAPENSSPTSPLHQHWCLSGLTRSWSRHSDSVSSCAGLQEAMAGYEKGTTLSYSTQPLQSLNGDQGVAQSKMTAFHLTGVQPRTQGFVSTLSVQGRQTSSKNSKRSFPHWESSRKWQHRPFFTSCTQIIVF